MWLLGGVTASAECSSATSKVFFVRKECEFLEEKGEVCGALQYLEKGACLAHAKELIKSM